MWSASTVLFCYFQPNGKQGTKDLKQIEEENKGTLNVYFYIILGVNES
jgi:hypothetical protein